MDAIELNTGPLLALQQLLVKGLFQGDTETLTLAAFGSICRQIAREAEGSVVAPFKSSFARSHPSKAFAPRTVLVSTSTSPFCIESILGDVSIGLAITIASTLPWIFVQANLKEFPDLLSSFLEDVSEACRCVGWYDVSAALLCLESDPNSKISDIDMSLRSWSKEAMPIIMGELFPDYSLLFIQRIVETVQRAPSVYQRAALYILEAIFLSSSDPSTSRSLNIGNDEQILRETSLVDTLAEELNGDLGGVVVRVMRALSRYQNTAHIAADGQLPTYYSWKNSVDEIGECNKLCAGALSRVAMSCPRSGELVVGEGEHAHLMPFLNE